MDVKVLVVSCGGYDCLRRIWSLLSMVCCERCEEKRNWFLIGHSWAGASSPDSHEVSGERDSTASRGGEGVRYRGGRVWPSCLKEVQSFIVGACQGRSAGKRVGGGGGWWMTLGQCVRARRIGGLDRDNLDIIRSFSKSKMCSSGL